jgi:hypothetical protein
MSWDYDPPDGTCESCGVDLDADPDGDHDKHHRQCWSCWRGDRAEPDEDWHEPRPPAGTPPESFIVALAGVRRELDELRRRLERLEGAA